MLDLAAARRGDGAVAALVDGDIHDDGAFLHGLDHLVGDDHGGELAGDQRGAEHHVHVRQDRRDGFPLTEQGSFGELLGIAARSDGFLSGDAQLHGLGTQGLGLLHGRGTDVGGVGDRAETLGGGQSLQARHAHADDQHVAGAYHAHGAEDLGHELFEVGSGHQHALIASHGAHGREGVHILGAGDAGHTVQSEADNALLRHILDHLMVHGRGGMDEGDDVLTGMHHVDLGAALLLVEQGLLDLQDHVRAGVQVGNVRHHLGTSRCIGFVSEESADASAVFHQHMGAVLDELRHGFRGSGHTALAVHDFFRDTDDHLFFLHFYYIGYFVASGSGDRMFLSVLNTRCVRVLLTPGMRLMSSSTRVKVLVEAVTT